MALEVRTIQSSEFPSFVACAGAGFFHPVADGYPEYFLGDVDLDRTWAAFDGGGLVGTLRSFATELTVPGPAARARGGAHECHGGSDAPAPGPSHRDDLGRPSSPPAIAASTSEC